MKSIPNAVLAELQGASVFPITFVELIAPAGGGGTLRYGTADKEVLWSGKLFAPRSVSYASNKQTKGGESATYELEIDNYDSALSAWAGQASLPIGGDANVWEGLGTLSADGQGRIVLVGGFAWPEFSGKITSVKIESVFTVVIKTAYDMHKAKGPAREQSTLCRFRGKTGKNGFKGRNCGYAGSETRCNFTFTRCTELGNQARFGGFPDLDDRSFE